MTIEEMCYAVIGAAMAVHRHFGTGYLEDVYKNALMIELKERGLSAEKEVAIPVDYKGIRVGDYRADIIVENRLILELKAVSSINPSHEAQLVNYLNATKIDDGLLINFGAESLERKHKYRIYRPGIERSPTPNPNPVNNVSNKKVALCFQTHYLQDLQNYGKFGTLGEANPVNPVNNVSNKKGIIL